MEQKPNTFTGKRFRLAGRHLMVAAIAAAMALSSVPAVSLAAQETDHKSGGGMLHDDFAAQPGRQTVKSIQAYTDQTFYGTAVVEVEITYEDNVDLSGVSKEDYELLDRGSLNPDYGRVPISSVKVNQEQHKVTLEIASGTTATANNTLDYSSAGTTGKRERNTFGAVVTGSWYRDASGNIHYGKEADAEKGYQANTTGMGYQARESLELVLRHTDDPEDPGLHLADEKGQYSDKEKWQPTIDRQLTEGGFRDLYALEIPSTAAGAGDLTADA